MGFFAPTAVVITISAAEVAILVAAVATKGVPLAGSAKTEGISGFFAG